MKIVKSVRPPSGVSRTLFRAPIYLYRLGLGWLFGKRILLLNHIGRVSGKQRQVILEVVEHDPTDESFVVACGWGPTAAWYRNILHTPQVSIQVGRHTIPVTALPLTEEDGAEIFARYAVQHRAAATYLLPRLMGLLSRRIGGRLPGGWATNAVRPVGYPGLKSAVSHPGGPSPHGRYQRFVSRTFQAPPTTSPSARSEGLTA